MTIQINYALTITLGINVDNHQILRSPTIILKDLLIFLIKYRRWRKTFLSNFSDTFNDSVRKNNSKILKSAAMIPRFTLSLIFSQHLIRLTLLPFSVMLLCLPKYVRSYDYAYDSTYYSKYQPNYMSQHSGSGRNGYEYGSGSIGELGSF